MPDGEDAIAWDFLTLVDAWNLYGLPVLLAIVVVVVLVRCRSRSVRAAWRAGSRTVLLVGLIHVALACQALISLVQELLTLRVMGIPQSFVSPVGAVFSSLVNPILAIGLLRHSRLVRRLAIAWYVLLSSLAALVAAWLIYYRVWVGLASWPDQLVAKVLPVLLLVVMFLPRIKRVFQAHVPEEEPRDGWPLLSLLTLVFLIVVCSNLVVNAADWANRLIFESESLP
jgi:hypothetical protein